MGLHFSAAMPVQQASAPQVMGCSSGLGVGFGGGDGLGLGVGLGVGDGDGEGVGLGVGDGDGEGEGAGDGLGLGLGAGLAQAVARSATSTTNAIPTITHLLFTINTSFLLNLVAIWLSLVRRFYDSHPLPLFYLIRKWPESVGEFEEGPAVGQSSRLQHQEQNDDDPEQHRTNPGGKSRGQIGKGCGEGW